METPDVVSAHARTTHSNNPIKSNPHNLGYHKVCFSHFTMNGIRKKICNPIRIIAESIPSVILSHHHRLQFCPTYRNSSLFRSKQTNSSWKEKELWKRVLILAYQDDTLSFCMPCFSILSSEHNLPHCSSWRCRQALGNHFVFVSSRILKLVQQHPNEVRRPLWSRECDHM